MAKLIRCPAGHVYDTEAHDTCPECARTAGQVAESEAEQKGGSRDDTAPPKKGISPIMIGGAVVAVLVFAGLFLFWPSPKPADNTEATQESAEGSTPPAAEDKTKPEVKPSETPEQKTAEGEVKPETEPSAASEEKSAKAPAPPSAAPQTSKPDPKTDVDYQACEARTTDDTALGACDRAIAADTFSGSDLAELYFRRGQRRTDKNDNDAALTDFSAAIKLDPQKAGFFWSRGDIYRSQEKYDVAIEDYDKGIALDPKSVGLFGSRGFAFLLKGDPDSAIKDFDVAAELDPKNVKIYNNRGLAFEKKGQLDRALQDYERATSIDPNYVYAQLGKANVYNKKGDRPKAIEAYEKSLSLIEEGDSRRKAIEEILQELKRESAAPASPSTEPQQAASASSSTEATANASASAPQNAADSSEQEASEAGLTGSQASGASPAADASEQSAGEPAAAEDKKEQEAKAATPSSKADPKTDADYQVCGGTPGDAALAACDRAIAAGNFSGRDLARLYWSRGLSRSLIKNDDDNALTDFSEAIKLDPTHAGYFLSRGDIYRGKNEFDVAIEDYDKGIALDSKNATLLGSRAFAFVLKGDPDAALKDLDAAAQLDPNAVRIYFIRGLAFEKKGQLDLALQDYERATSVDPKYFLAQLNKANLYNKKGDRPHAVEAYEAALALLEPGDSRRAGIEESLGKLKSESAVPGAVVAAGASTPAAAPPPKLNAQEATAAADADIQTCADASGDVAIAACDRAIASGRYDDAALVTLYVNRGAKRGANKDLDGAIADLSEAIKLDPNKAMAFNNRGQVYRIKGDRDRAVQDYDQAIKLDPKFVSAFYNRGVFYADKRDYDRAIQDFDQAITLDANSLKAYRARGDAYRRKGDKEHAVADYQEALKLNPDADTKKKIDAALYALNSSPPPAAPAAASPAGGEAPSAAWIAEAMSDPDFPACTNDKKEEACKRVIASGKLKGPPLALSYHALSRIFVGREKWSDVIQYEDKAIEIDPAFAGAFENRCYALRSAGELDRALQDCNQAIALAPKFFDAYFTRGRIYEKKGQPDLARADYEKALSLGSTDKAFESVVTKALAALPPAGSQTGQAAAPAGEPKPSEGSGKATPAVASGDVDEASKRCFFEATEEYSEEEVLAACDIAINSGKFSGKQLVEMLEARGFVHELRKEFDLALRDYDELVRLNPTWFAFLLRAQTYQEKGDVDAAIADYKKVLSLNPTEGKAEAALAKLSPTDSAAESAIPVAAAAAGPNGADKTARNCGGSGKLLFDGGFADFDANWAFDMAAGPGGQPEPPKVGADGLSATLSAKDLLVAATKSKFQDVEVCTVLATNSHKNSGDQLILRFWFGGDGVRYYAIAFPAKGVFFVKRDEKGKDATLVTGKTVDASLLNEAGENEFAVRLHGSDGAFLVNGKRISKFHREPAGGASEVGFSLFAGSDSTEPVRFVMNSFQVRELTKDEIADMTAPIPSPIQFCNEFAHPVHVAIAFKDGKAWTSEGWLNLQPNECETFSKRPDLKLFYYRAESDVVDGQYVQWGHDRTFSVQNGSFELANAEKKAKGTRTVKFAGPIERTSPEQTLSVTFTPDMGALATTGPIPQ